MRRFNIVQGDPTTAGNGSKVIGAVGMDTNEGRSIAMHGDKVYCGVCKTVGVIVCDGPRSGQTFNGREAALNNDLCLCKCRPPPRLINSMESMSQTMSTEEVVKQGFGDWVGVKHDEQFTLRDQRSGKPLARVRYRVKTASGQVVSGITDANGATQRVRTKGAESLTFQIFHD